MHSLISDVEDTVAVANAREGGGKVAVMFLGGLILKGIRRLLSNKKLITYAPRETPQVYIN